MKNIVNMFPLGMDAVRIRLLGDKLDIEYSLAARLAQNLPVDDAAYEALAESSAPPVPHQIRVMVTKSAAGDMVSILSSGRFA